MLESPSLLCYNADCCVLVLVVNWKIWCSDDGKHLLLEYPASGIVLIFR